MRLPSTVAFAVLLAVAMIVAACAQAPGTGGASPDLTPPAISTPESPEQPGGGGGDSGNERDPSRPVGAEPPPAEPGPTDGALHVEPEPGIVDARPHAWDHITVAPDGRTLTIYWWGGVESCHGLAGVDVQTDDEGRPVIRVLEGRRGDLPPDTACIEIALLKATTIELDEPIIAPAQ